MVGGSLSLLAVLTFSWFGLTQPKTTGVSGSLPDNDKYLQELVWNQVLKEANEFLRASVWWVPKPGAGMNAKLVMTPQKDGTKYRGYNLQLTLVPTNCNKSTPFYRVRNCKAITTSQQRVCDAGASVFESQRNLSVEDVEVMCR